MHTSRQYYLGYVVEVVPLWYTLPVKLALFRLIQMHWYSKGYHSVFILCPYVHIYSTF